MLLVGPEVPIAAKSDSVCRGEKLFLPQMSVPVMGHGQQVNSCRVHGCLQALDHIYEVDRQKFDL